MPELYVKNMLARNVPFPFINFAKYHLRKAGYDYEKFDLSRYYNHSFSLDANIQEFQKLFPVTLIRKGRYVSDNPLHKQYQVDVYAWNKR